MIRVEQLVYGTFRFTQGFTLVSASEGVAPQLAQQVVGVCKAWGEILSPDFRSALYHVPLAIPAGGGDAAESEFHLVGKVVRQGTDSGDRMAWYQQVLVIGATDYLQAGADPFAFDAAGFFKERWFESDRCVPVEVSESILPVLSAEAIPSDHREIAGRLCAAVIGGSEVRILAARATRLVTALFHEVISLMPVEDRARVAVATFAYHPVRHYNLWCLHEVGGPAPERIDEIVYRVEHRRD